MLCLPSTSIFVDEAKYLTKLNKLFSWWQKTVSSLCHFFDVTRSKSFEIFILVVVEDFKENKNLIIGLCSLQNISRSDAMFLNDTTMKELETLFYQTYLKVRFHMLSINYSQQKFKFCHSKTLINLLLHYRPCIFFSHTT